MAKQNIILDKRVSKINDILIEYSHGKFSKKLFPGKKFDEIDAIMFSLNLLGEEMQETTISKNYFTQIYDSIKEMIFELDGRGKIINYNKAVDRKLGFSQKELISQNINTIIEKTDLFHPKFDKKALNEIKFDVSYYYMVRTKESSKLYCLCQWLPFYDKKSKVKYLLTAKNISNEKKLEQSNMRDALIALENERSRLAKDLHDSIGQQLSAIKLYFGTVSNNEKITEVKKMIDRCDGLLNDITKDIRSICFDLLPRTVVEKGFIKGLQELANQLNVIKKIKVVIKADPITIKLSQEIEVTIYRTLQEFVNNSIKHSKGSLIQITINEVGSRISITAKDNGIGFNIDKMKEQGKGYGLQSMESRISSIGGQIKWNNAINKRTSFTILI